jgi:hypothetical protein
MDVKSFITLDPGLTQNIRTMTEISACVRQSGLFHKAVNDAIMFLTTITEEISGHIVVTILTSIHYQVPVTACSE